eukprot:TRINITY_DN122894_c0_g1_i1.p1 TRINITY_DN122894_c0_g1~~TRINITY_DN122894_c0_g1_i1.p1  ORF type:complete len:407 (-),score=127.86 TRINITY_DN122894_c0_g1_i1:129-1349(-)
MDALIQQIQAVCGCCSGSSGAKVKVVDLAAATDPATPFPSSDKPTSPQHAEDTDPVGQSARSAAPVPAAQAEERLEDSPSPTEETAAESYVATADTAADAEAGHEAHTTEAAEGQYYADTGGYEEQAQGEQAAAYQTGDDYAYEQNAEQGYDQYQEQTYGQQQEWAGEQSYEYTQDAANAAYEEQADAASGTGEMPDQSSAAATPEAAAAGAAAAPSAEAAEAPATAVDPMAALQGYVKEADALFQARDYARASAIYTAALEQAPPNVEKDKSAGPARDLLCNIYVRRGQCYQAVKKSDDALIDYNKAAALKPAALSILRLRAEMNLEKRNYELAIQDFNEIIVRDPSDARSIYGRARSFLGRNQSKAAREDLETAKAMGQQQAALLLQKLDAYMTAKAGAPKKSA